MYGVERFVQDRAVAGSGERTMLSAWQLCSPQGRTRPPLVGKHDLMPAENPRAEQVTEHGLRMAGVVSARSPHGLWLVERLKARRAACRARAPL